MCGCVLTECGRGFSLRRMERYLPSSGKPLEGGLVLGTRRTFSARRTGAAAAIRALKPGGDVTSPARDGDEPEGAAASICARVR